MAIGQWQSFAPGLEAGETTYRAYGWSAPRRLVVVRELLDERPEARGHKLLDVPGYTFHVLVTTLSHDPVTTWRFYNSRTESENRIKELIVGSGKTMLLRCLQAELDREGKVLVSKSLSVDKDRATLTTFIVALFYDLSPDKEPRKSAMISRRSPDDLSSLQLAFTVKQRNRYGST